MAEQQNDAGVSSSDDEFLGALLTNTQCVIQKSQAENHKQNKFFLDFQYGVDQKTAYNAEEVKVDARYILK